MAPTPPQNVMSRNVGNGVVEIQFSPAVGAVSYNVYIATSLAGTYRKANLSPVLWTTTKLPNIPFGLTVYLKVTAVNVGGEESALSTAALDAVCLPGVVTLRFEDIVGARIPVGAVYAVRMGAAQVSFVTTTAGICR